MKRSFNINDFVWVKLNALGRKIYADYYKALNLPVPELIEEDGHARFQMWDLMNIFGPHIGSGPLPFDTTEIKLDFPREQPTLRSPHWRQDNTEDASRRDPSGDLRLA